MAERRRVVMVQTHPVQYLSPWFRWMTAHEPSIELTVLYAAEPTPEAQGAGFGSAFSWEAPLREGYANRVLSTAAFGGRLDASRPSPIDAPALEAALRDLSPRAVIVPGWHAAYYRRALDLCRRHRWPAIYRGDSTRSSGRPGVPRAIRRVVTRARLRRFDAWLAVGAASREYLIEHGAADPLIFDSPHAVETAFFERAAVARRDVERRSGLRRAFGLDPARPVVLFAGKLHPVKRPLDLVRALGQAVSRPQLLVAGTGQLEAHCRAEATRLGVTATFAGFLQPGRMVDAYAAADVLVLPSERETWGLVVNEALASGIPVVVSDAVGCRPDLVDEQTGAVYGAGDVTALSERIEALLARPAADRAAVADACLARARRYGYAAATEGLIRTLDRLEQRRSAPPAGEASRLVACCGGMSQPGGLERMTFEVLRVARRQGVHVHCIVNTWGSRAIVGLAEEIGASWSTGYYWHPLQRRVWRPAVAARMAWDVGQTSLGLWRDARRLRAGVVLVPDFTVALRNLPALLLLRASGVRIVHRLGVAPEPGPRYGRMWRRILAPAADILVCNSAFTARALAAHGVPADKVAIVPNVLPAGRDATAESRPVPGRLLYAGQIIPGKGVHLLLEAVALLLARRHDVTLDIAGAIDGWESPTWAGYHTALRARAARRDLHGRVRFLGWQDDVPALMREAWIHVAPSLPELAEGFGIVVLEAKAAGVPSVVGASGALPDLVSHGEDGWVADPPTAESLARGLAPLLDADARSRASAAARASLARYSPDAFARGWAAAFAWPGTAASCVEARSCP